MKKRLPASILGGFTLVELLFVIAIIAILLALAGPAMNSLSGMGVKRAVSSTADFLELARTEAMAKSTWVWVGIADTTKDSDDKVPELTLAAAASLDGTTNSMTNLALLTKLVRVKGVGLRKVATKWNSASNNSPPVEYPLITSGNQSFQVMVRNKPMIFSDTVIAFSPQGEALIRANQVVPWVEIGFNEKKGTMENADRSASIRFSGLSGQVLIAY